MSAYAKIMKLVAWYQTRASECAAEAATLEAHGAAAWSVGWNIRRANDFYDKAALCEKCAEIARRNEEGEE